MQKSLNIIVGFVFSVSILSSCMSGLEPLPNEVGDLDLSLSIPVAKVEVALNQTYHIGPPDCFLGLNVPDWAKHSFIYYADTVTVDLYKIFENSKDIYQLAFTVNIWNEYPVAAEIYMNFIDNTGANLHSFEPIPILGGSVLFNGNIVRAEYNKSTIVFDKALIENIKTAQGLVFNIKLIIKNGNTNYFKYFDQFKMDCHIGARVDFILNDI